MKHASEIEENVSIEVEKNEAPEEENLASMTEEEEVKVTIEDLLWRGTSNRREVARSWVRGTPRPGRDVAR